MNLIWDLFNYPKKSDLDFNSDWKISNPPMFDANTPMWNSQLDEIIIFKPITYYKIWCGLFSNSPLFSYNKVFKSVTVKVAFNKETKIPLFNPLILNDNGLPIIGWDIDNPPTGSWGIDKSKIDILPLSEYIDLLPS